MDGPKIVYVARNPKDAAISAYHHFKNLLGLEGTLNDLLECFLGGYTFYGSQFQHMEEYIRLAKLKNNLLVVTFEDLVTNPVQVVRRVADFLEVTLSDEDAIKVAAYISFDKMKKRENSNFHEFVDFNAQRNVKTDFKWVWQHSFDITFIVKIYDHQSLLSGSSVKERRAPTRRKCRRNLLNGSTRK